MPDRDELWPGRNEPILDDPCDSYAPCQARAVADPAFAARALKEAGAR